MIEMHAVESSQVKAIGYGYVSGTLHVEFHSGGTYSYDHVTLAQYEALRSAPSVGKAFAAFKKLGHLCRRVE